MGPFAKADLARPAVAVQIVPSFDSQQMLRELTSVTDQPWKKQRGYRPGRGIGAANSSDWRVLPLRSAWGDSSRTDPGGPGEVFAHTPWLDQLPYIRSVIDQFPGPLQGVRVMSFGPGASSSVHRDRKFSLLRGYARFHIPVVTNPQCVLHFGDIRYQWQPGECWYADFSKTHQSRNDGTETRIHVVLDALMNRELIGLFPEEWRPGLDADDVLLNRPALPLTSAWDPPFGERSLAIPEVFTRFESDDELISTSLVPARITVANGQSELADASGKVFHLVHLGDDEFRFAGWSESAHSADQTGSSSFPHAQRTLREYDDGAVRA